MIMTWFGHETIIVVAITETYTRVEEAEEEAEERTNRESWMMICVSDATMEYTLQCTGMEHVGMSSCAKWVGHVFNHLHM